MYDDIIIGQIFITFELISAKSYSFQLFWCAQLSICLRPLDWQCASAPKEEYLWGSNQSLGSIFINMYKAACNNITCYKWFRRAKDYWWKFALCFIHFFGLTTNAFVPFSFHSLLAVSGSLRGLVVCSLVCLSLSLRSVIQQAYASSVISFGWKNEDKLVSSPRLAMLMKKG